MGAVLGTGMAAAGASLDALSAVVGAVFGATAATGAPVVLAASVPGAGAGTSIYPEMKGTAEDQTSSSTVR